MEEQEPDRHPVYEDPQRVRGFIEDAIQWLDHCNQSANHTTGVLFQCATHCGMALATIRSARELGHSHLIVAEQEERLLKAIDRQMFHQTLLGGVLDTTRKAVKFLERETERLQDDRDDCLVTYFPDEDAPAFSVFE